jgi:hypothetical protein
MNEQRVIHPKLFEELIMSMECFDLTKESVTVCRGMVMQMEN